MNTTGVLMCKNSGFQQYQGIYAWCIATFQLPYQFADKPLTKIYQQNETRMVLTQEYLNQPSDLLFHN